MKLQLFIIIKKGNVLITTTTVLCPMFYFAPMFHSVKWLGSYHHFAHELLVKLRYDSGSRKCRLFGFANLE
jgi:hypothetical protein